MDDSGWSTNKDIDTEIRRQVRKTRRTGGHAVGYGKPPVDTRWKPGQSGNPNGRPKKIERAFTERQMLRDFVNAMEREVTITIEGKKKRMPFIVAIYEQAAIQAAKGRFRFFAKIVDMHRHAIELTARLNPGTTKMLESVEQHMAETGEFSQMQPGLVDELNKLKRRTRRL